jgi:hypothetical protein
MDYDHKGLIPIPSPFIRFSLTYKFSSPFLLLYTKLLSFLLQIPFVHGEKDDPTYWIT